MSPHFRFALLAVLTASLTACYSFKGISIAPEVKTYYVSQFQDNALNAPPNLYQTVTEVLREKVRNETRLVQNEETPDIEFVGTLVDYRVTAEAPRPGEFAAVNRLTIVVKVDYINNKVESDQGFSSNFSFFFDFPGTVTLQAVENDAIEEILDQITEDIFNKAFSSWD